MADDSWERLKVQIEKAGLWPAYVELRQNFIDDGLDSRKAHDFASQHMLDALATRKPKSHQKKKSPAPELSERDRMALDGADPEKLVLAATGRQTGSALDGARWVARMIHLANLLGEKFPYHLAPDEEAAWLLRFATKSPQHEMFFAQHVWSKTLPTRSQIETQAKFRDEGESLEELCNMYQQALREESSGGNGDSRF